WAGYYEGRDPRRTPLPSYAFKRTRCWFTGDNPPESEYSRDQTIPAPELQRAAGQHTRSSPKASDIAQLPAPRRNKIEEALVSISEDLLGIPSVGVHDNVVELGADSLFTMQLSRRISDTFGVSISPHHLFAEPNIASLARKIADLGPRSDRLGEAAETIV